MPGALAAGLDPARELRRRARRRPAGSFSAAQAPRRWMVVRRSLNDCAGGGPEHLPEDELQGHQRRRAAGSARGPWRCCPSITRKVPKGCTSEAMPDLMRLTKSVKAGVCRKSARSTARLPDQVEQGEEGLGQPEADGVLDVGHRPGERPGLLLHQAPEVGLGEGLERLQEHARPGSCPRETSFWVSSVGLAQVLGQQLQAGDARLGQLQQLVALDLALGLDLPDGRGQPADAPARRGSARRRRPPGW